MMNVVKTDVFDKWLVKLKDRQAAASIQARIRRFMTGNLGDVKPVGNGVSEARIFVGKGYRLYFIMDGAELIVLLCGGDKSSQQRDIELAKKLAKQWKEG